MRDSRYEEGIVGIVLVSQSADVVEAVAKLAWKITSLNPAGMPVVGVGGMPHGEPGVSPEDILEGIQSVDCGAGVVILVDMVSTIGAVKVALANGGKQLPDNTRLLVDAPFIGGAVAAIRTAASTGGDLAAVEEAAVTGRWGEPYPLSEDVR
ncbi:phosphoenolpyruvate--protein phosphotransferase [Nonomuraea longicatena]|uniref:PTS fructose transporter subunit IIA n=1 Tax=Nonomuraea longicatena TaxID=83682 RepID=A0ABN1NUH2_9ACTN